MDIRAEAQDPQRSRGDGITDQSLLFQRINIQKEVHDPFTFEHKLIVQLQLEEE
jgi:hypothetical protein